MIKVKFFDLNNKEINEFIVTRIKSELDIDRIIAKIKNELLSNKKIVYYGVIYNKDGQNYSTGQKIFNEDEIDKKLKHTKMAMHRSILSLYGHAMIKKYILGE